MELSGPVQTETIRSLIEEIDQKRWSGTLHLEFLDKTQLREEAYLLFLQGRLVTCHKKRNNENFPQELVTHDIISVSRLQDLLQKMRREDKRLENLLVQEKIIEAGQAPVILGKIMLDRLSFLFEPLEGRYHFQQQSGDALDLAVSELALPNDDLFFKEGLSYYQIFEKEVKKGLAKVDAKEDADEGELTFEDYLLKFPSPPSTPQAPATAEIKEESSPVVPLHVPMVQLEHVVSDDDITIETTPLETQEETTVDVRILPESEDVMDINVDIAEGEIAGTLGVEKEDHEFIDIFGDLGFDVYAARQMGEDEMAFLGTMVQELNLPESDITLLLLRYASSIFDRGVLFKIEDGTLKSVGAFGLEKDEDQAALNLGGLQIPVDQSSMFATSLIDRSLLRGEVAAASIDERFFEMLGGAPAEVFVAPIFSAFKPISLLYGDFGKGADLKKRTIGLEIFLSQIGLELEKKFLKERLEEIQGHSESPKL